VAAWEALPAPPLPRRLIAEHVRPPAPLHGVPRQLRSLTGRELEVLALIAKGLSNEQVATRLVVADTTVKTHVNRIFAKLGASSRAQLVVLAYESGLVRPGESSVGQPG
jgi:ATP/maltotriose-dependent transcriptional regulator MalT